MPINSITLSTTKSMSAATALMPTLTLFFGGLLAWKLWQQHQKITENATLQSELSERIDTLEQAYKKEKETEVSVSSTTKKSTASPSSKIDPLSTAPSKNGLFEQLISENIEIRGAH